MRIHPLLFLLCLIGSGCLQAQSTVTLTFTAIFNGLHQPLDSITILNLTQGGDTMLYGPDTLLVLHSNVGIPNNDQSTSSGLFLYPAFPNPFNGTTTVRFYLAQADPVAVRVCDRLGRELARFTGRLQPGDHQVDFYAGEETLYLLTVETPLQQQVQKLISTGSHGVPCRLDYTGWQQGFSGLKKSKSTFPWAPWNNLRFIGHTSSGKDTIDAQPYQSTQYTFQYVSVLCPLTVTDINGNIYNTVLIGYQCWMKENLKARNYRNGTIIPNITDGQTWINQSTGARCWHNNDSATYAATYGALYNWYAVVDANGLCPTGWHVPTDQEWQALEMSLGMGASVTLTGWRGTDEGGKMKETGTTHWNSPNIGATNSSGFTALPGGCRDSNLNANYVNMGYNGYWWSTTAYSSPWAWYRCLSSGSSMVNRNYHGKNYGSPVRCVMD